MAGRAPRPSFGPLLAILFVAGAIYSTIANQRYDRPSSPAAPVTKQSQAPVANQKTPGVTIDARPPPISRETAVAVPLGNTPPVQSLEIPDSALAKNRSSSEASNRNRSSAALPPALDMTTPAPVAVAADKIAKPQLPPPRTGDIVPRRGRKAIAPFTVVTELGPNYLIKLVNVDNASDQIWIYLKGGESYSTTVPVGAYNFRAATGNEWYGREALFGPSTRFFRLRTKKGAAADAQQTLQFRKERNRLFGMTIILKGVADGNMEQEAMTRSEFDAN